MSEKKDNPSGATTHFGYKQVPVESKHKHVAGVFHSVASKYDMMNDLMSLGTHRVLKRYLLELSSVRKGQQVLDLAGGTGDITKLLSKNVGPSGRVMLCDINDSMLSVGRDRLLDDGFAGNIHYVQANGEVLPFEDGFFDCVTIGYGIRNFTNKPKALVELLRVLRPGGRLLILEFSKPQSEFVSKAYDIYAKSWPIVGKLVAGDSDSYQYLNESIRMHPDQATFKQMMEDAGFEQVEYFNLLGGVSAIHRGFKF